MRKIFILRTKKDAELYEAREDIINRVRAGYYKTKNQFLKELETLQMNLIPEPAMSKETVSYPFIL